MTEKPAIHREELVAGQRRELRARVGDQGPESKQGPFLFSVGLAVASRGRGARPKPGQVGGSGRLGGL